jgi:hypothetical protein
VLPSSGIGELAEIQKQARDAVAAFQPWELGKLYTDQLARMSGLDPSVVDERDSPDFKDCMATPVREIKHLEFDTCLNLHPDAEPDRLCKSQVCRATIRARIKNENGGGTPGLMIPLTALFYMVGNLFYQKPLVWALVVIAQLISGAAIVVVAIRWYAARKNLSHPLVIFIAPLGVIVIGSIAAIPVKWAAELGVEIFRWIIQSGGLVAQACCSIYLPVVCAQKALELPLHRLGEKGLAVLFHRWMK